MPEDKTIERKEDCRLNIEGKDYALPVYRGTQDEEGLDISGLRKETGRITLDPGLGNTGFCTSKITFIDGDKGILRYRGIPIEEMAERSSFLETAYLLIYDDLPSRETLARFEDEITRHSLLHEDMKRFFHGYPKEGMPMSILSAMVCSLSSYYPDCMESSPEKADIHIYRLLSKISTIASFSYKKSIAQPYVGPLNRLSYVENFFNMMFSVPAEPYQAPPAAVTALEKILILHADHEQNCSTTTVRVVGSSEANLYATISAGICALWGPLHGGANQAVLEMLGRIEEKGGDVKAFIQGVKDKKERLMGFGHRVYKNFDPRAKILKASCDEVLGALKKTSRQFEIAKELEAAALSDDYFKERKLYPNVDFYSGIILSAIGIPANMFPVIFAMGRLPGWIAQWREMRLDPEKRIARPRQIYTGFTKRAYTPMGERQ